MKTTIEGLWEDIEKFGFEAVKSKRDHYMRKEKEVIANAFESGRTVGLSNFTWADGNYYYKMEFETKENETTS
jgi:hypothetical protein